MLPHRIEVVPSYLNSYFIYWIKYCLHDLRIETHLHTTHQKECDININIGLNNNVVVLVWSAFYHVVLYIRCNVKTRHYGLDIHGKVPCLTYIHYISLWHKYIVIRNVHSQCFVSYRIHYIPVIFSPDIAYDKRFLQSYTISPCHLIGYECNSK